MSRRIRIMLELHPEQGNPIVIRDSTLILPGESLLTAAERITERSVAWLTEKSEAIHITQA